MGRGQGWSFNMNRPSGHARKPHAFFFLKKLTLQLLIEASWTSLDTLRLGLMALQVNVQTLVRLSPGFESLGSHR